MRQAAHCAFVNSFRGLLGQIRQNIYGLWLILSNLFSQSDAISTLQSKHFSPIVTEIAEVRKFRPLRPLFSSSSLPFIEGKTTSPLLNYAYCGIPV